MGFSADSRTPAVRARRRHPHLDWRALARSDRYYVTHYVDETNLRATIVVDASGSMDFAGEQSDAVAGRGMSKLNSCPVPRRGAGLRADPPAGRCGPGAVRHADSPLHSGHESSHAPFGAAGRSSCQPARRRNGPGRGAARRCRADPRRGVLLLSDLFDDRRQLFPRSTICAFASTKWSYFT